MTASPQDTLARRFERFARLECHGSSPIYERLSFGIAADPDLLALAAQARPGQPTPNLFLGAVHALLLDGVQHPLARISIADRFREGDDPLLGLVTYKNGVKQGQMLAACDAHARWIAWRDQEGRRA